MHELVAAVDMLPSHESGRIRAKTLPSTLATVAESTPGAWLPIELNVELTENLSVVLGAERTREFFRSMTLAEYQTSLFKTFLATVTRLLSLTPAVFVKMTPRGWNLVFRACGVFRPLEREGRTARLLFSAIPEVCCKNQLWLESVRSAFYTAFDLSQVTGEIIWDDLDLDARRAVFLFRWS
jgi:hypothetical protein